MILAIFCLKIPFFWINKHLEMTSVYPICAQRWYIQECQLIDCEYVNDFEKSSGVYSRVWNSSIGGNSSTGGKNVQKQ